MNNRKIKPNATLIKAVLYGTAVSVLMTVVFAALIAYMLQKQIVDLENMGYGVMVLLLMSAYAGGYTSCKMKKESLLTVSISCAAAYLITLLTIGVLFYDGKLNAVGETMLLILCGNILSAMWISRGKGSGKRHKLNIPNG